MIVPVAELPVEASEVETPSRPHSLSSTGRRRLDQALRAYFANDEIAALEPPRPRLRLRVEEINNLIAQFGEASARFHTLNDRGVRAVDSLGRVTNLMGSSFLFEADRARAAMHSLAGTLRRGIVAIDSGSVANNPVAREDEVRVTFNQPSDNRGTEPNVEVRRRTTG